jgi:hypothetical protein
VEEGLGVTGRWYCSTGLSDRTGARLDWELPQSPGGPTDPRVPVRRGGLLLIPFPLPKPSMAWQMFLHSTD